MRVFIYDHAQATDVGGSIAIHLFGAIFGLAVSWGLMLRDRPTYLDPPQLSSGRNSNMFSMIGLLLLYIFETKYEILLNLKKEKK